MAGKETPPTDRLVMLSGPSQKLLMNLFYGHNESYSAKRPPKMRYFGGFWWPRCVKIPPHGQCAQSLSSTPVRRTLQVVLTDGALLFWSFRRYGFSNQQGKTDERGWQTCLEIRVCLDPKLPPPTQNPNFPSHQNHIETLNIANDPYMEY